AGTEVAEALGQDAVDVGPARADRQLLAGDADLESGWRDQRHDRAVGASERVEHLRALAPIEDFFELVEVRVEADTALLLVHAAERLDRIECESCVVAAHWPLLRMPGYVT